MVKHGSSITMYGGNSVWFFSRAIDFHGNINSLCHALNFANKLEVDTVITTGLLPLQYSNKPPVCNKYIAKNIVVQLFFRSSRSEAVYSITFGMERAARWRILYNAVARSIVGKQLPPGTLDEEKPLFFQNSSNDQVYTPF